jgi:hypothetical protein
MTYKFKLARRLAGFPIVLSALLLLQSSCQAGEQIAGFAPPDTVVARVLVTPQVDTTATTQTVHLTAVALNAAGDPVPAPLDWSASGGTVDSTGHFHSAVPGLFRVRVRHRTQTQLIDSSTIVVSNAAPQLTGVSINPSSAAVLAGASRQFGVTGTWSDGSNGVPLVTYSATGGTVSSSGLFTAGSTAGTFRVVATAQSAVLADTATVTISVPVATLTSLTLTPGSAALLAGATRQFSVAGTWSDGSSTPPAVTYSATGGSVNASGLYTAGSAAGTYRVIAIQQGGTLADTSVITITVPAPTLTSLDLSPATASLQVGGARQFSVAGTWSDGSTSAPAVNYSATGGTINASGLYTAGSSAGTFRVIASQQGGTLADTSVVTISIPVATLTSLVINPASASILTGGTKQFTVAGTWSDGSSTAPAVTYSATGGSVSPSGLYTAGSTAGSYRVIAVQQGGTLADTADVTVSVPAPVLTGLLLTPGTASIQTGATQQFAVAASWSNGGTSVPPVTYSATGGSISQSGLYTAGSAAGTFRVIVAAQGSTVADTSDVTVTLPAPVLQGIVLSPNTLSILSGDSHQFTVSGVWSNGATTAPAVDYVATGGAVLTDGTYWAGTSAGTFRVIATVHGGTLADTSTITITTPAPVLQAVVLTPVSATVSSGATQQFSVAGQWSDGATTAPAVTYSATGGTITTAGLYTAGSTAGTFRVIATQQGGTLADTSAVTIPAAAPVLQAVILNPASASLTVGTTRQFSVSGQWSNGATTAPAVTYSATGGTITTAGLYTAGSTAGTFRVIAIQQSGTLADTAAVTLTASAPGGSGNLANMTFESGGFEGLSDGSGGVPVNGHVVVTGAYAGTHAFDVSMGSSSGDQGGSGYWVGGQQYQDLWVSFAVKVITAPTSGIATQKMVIFRNSQTMVGEMNQVDGSWIWNWLFTDPNKGNIYLTKLGGTTSDLGVWHTYKLHLQSHGTTTMTFGRDGVDNVITLTTTAAPAGIPSTLTFGGTLNAGSGPSHFQFDNIHIGTVDPGWP